MVRILGISSSPRRNGNTSYALKEALKSVEEKGFETRFLSLANKKIEPCVACDLCKKEARCSIKDDMDQVYDELESVDAIIFATPVYFGCMNSQMKALLDRSVMLLRNGSRLRNKVAGVIAVGGARNGGQEITIQAVQAALMIHGMIIVSDDMHFGGTVHADVGHPASEDKWGLETAKAVANKVAEVAKRLK